MACHVRPRSTFSLCGFPSFWIACGVAIFLSSHATALSAQVPKTCQVVDLKFDPGTDVHAIENFELAVAALLKEEQFAALDCTADAFRASKARFSGGAWKLNAVYGGLEDPWVGHATEEDWQDHIARVQRWVAANPTSITARIALSQSYSSYAWDARGRGTSDTVSQSGWKLFEQRLDKAKEMLDEAASLDAKCPEWYVAMARVARGQSWPVSEVNQLVEKAIAFEPLFYPIYRMQADFLLPKWYGEDGDTAKFAQQMADRLGGPEGDVLYFEIAMGLNCRCDEPEFYRMSWPRIQKGAAELEKQYGVSLLNLNQLALMSIRFYDPILADSLFTRLADNWDKDTWGTEAIFKKNRFWASDRAPQEAHQRDMMQIAETSAQTPQGSQYKAAFAEKFTPMVQQCVQSTPGDLTKFEFLMMVTSDGRASPALMIHASPVAACLRDTVTLPSTKPFPAPPRSVYWIVFEVDPAKYLVASK